LTDLNLQYSWTEWSHFDTSLVTVSGKYGAGFRLVTFDSFGKFHGSLQPLGGDTTARLYGLSHPIELTVSI
jgi:hypothetical protein